MQMGNPCLFFYNPQRRKPLIAERGLTTGPSPTHKRVGRANNKTNY